MSPTPAKPPTLVLDADGVFLSERPYWDAALAAALRSAGLLDRASGRLTAVADVAFGEVGLQRVTKRRGCNSNWDLAAVLVRALQSEPLRDFVGRCLDQRRDREAMRQLARGGAGLWRGGAVAGPADPLSAFGIQRDGEGYRRVVRACQDCLATPVADPAEDLAKIIEFLQRAVDLGYVLRVCTGRPRAEIEVPLGQLGLDRFLPAEALTCAEEAEGARRATDGAYLGKPHWFGPACAVLGFDRARQMLAGERPAAWPAPAVYVGDAWADYLSVTECRRQGLEMAYVHVRSGASTADQERRIAQDDLSLGVVDGLSEIVDLLPGVVA